MKHELLLWVRDIGIAVVIAIVIMVFFKPIIIQQESMEENFHSGDYVIISRQAYKMFGEVQRGDVMVFKSDLDMSNGKKKNLIKRIIGLPGDTIEIIDGYVYINGEMIDEPYVKEEGVSGYLDPVTVPEGTVFAMGDNRAVSHDSRDMEFIGCIDQETIMGKVVIRLYPFNQIKTF